MPIIQGLTLIANLPLWRKIVVSIKLAFLGVVTQKFIAGAWEESGEYFFIIPTIYILSEFPFVRSCGREVDWLLVSVALLTIAAVIVDIGIALI